MTAMYGREFDDDGNLVFDPDDPMAPVKEAAAAANEDDRPRAVARAVDAMARFGMDTGLRVTARAYVKKHKLLPAAEYDRVVKEARKRRKTISHSPLPADRAHLHTPPPWASDHDILRRMVRTLRVCMGLVGENRAAKLIYLAITSRLLGEPVNTVTKGLSSSGKSYTVECVVRLFPDEAVYTMTAMSEKALIFLDEPLEHRTIVLYEAVALREGREKAEDNQTAYIVRSLLSEGRIEYPVVLRDERTGELRTQTLIKPGPTNIVTSTTAVSLHSENETRMISVPSNDSEAQTRAVLIESSDDKKRGDADLSEWHAMQRWIATQKTRDVEIPYARCLAAQIPPVAVRLRRDWNAVRSLIKAHALLHQKNRKVAGDGRIIADIGDYTAIRSLIDDLIAEGIGATVPQTVRQTVEMVAAIANELDDRGESREYATVRDIADRLKIERSAAQRRLHTARDRGHLVNLEDRKGRPGRYATGDPLPGDVVVLPDPTHLCTAPCTHVETPNTAGQPCDCTGVCRCADDARGRQADTTPSTAKETLTGEKVAGERAPHAQHAPVDQTPRPDGINHGARPGARLPGTAQHAPDMPHETPGGAHWARGAHSPATSSPTCATCGEPMRAYETGQTTHPSCETRDTGDWPEDWPTEEEP